MRVQRGPDPLVHPLVHPPAHPLAHRLATGFLSVVALLASPLSDAVSHTESAPTGTTDAPGVVGAPATAAWRGVAAETRLDDGSLLSTYAGETPSLVTEGARLQVDFSPRFGCSPAARLVLDPPLAGRLDTTVGALDVAIDGTPLVWPAIHDALGTRHVVSYVGSERERSTLKLQLDVGDLITVELDPSTSLAFSLLGSRATLAAMQAACRVHVPEAIDGANTGLTEDGRGQVGDPD